MLRFFCLASILLLLGSVGLVAIDPEDAASGTSSEGYSGMPTRAIGNRSVGTSYDLLAKDDDWIESKNNIINKNGEFYSLEGIRPNLKLRTEAGYLSNYMGMNSRNIQEYEGTLYVGYVIYEQNYPYWTSFRLKVSTDNGITWEDTIEVYNSTYAREGNVEILVYQDKLFYLFSDNYADRIYLKVSNYKNWMDLEDQEPMYIESYYTMYTTMIGHQGDVFIFYKYSGNSYIEYRTYSSGVLQPDYYVNYISAYLMCPVSMTKGSISSLHVIYRDNSGMLKSCSSLNKGQTWSDPKNVLLSSYSIQAFSANCIGDSIHIVFSTSSDSYLRYVNYRGTAAVFPTVFATESNNGLDSIDREACITGSEDEIWIAAETGMGHVSVYVSYDDGDTFNKTFTLGNGNVHCPILDISLKTMSVINGSMMDVFTLDTIRSGSIISKVMSPIGLDSWVDFGFSFSGGASPSMINFRITEANGIQQVYPDSGYLSLSDLEQGSINGIYYNHFGQFTGDWISDSNLVDQIRMELRIMLGEGDRFELYGISINYSISLPWKGEFRSSEYIVSGAEQYSFSEDGARLDPINRMSKLVVGPLTFDDDMPDHLSIWCTFINSGVSLRCEVLNGAMEPITGFTQWESVIVTEAKKEIYIRWGAKQLGNLHNSSKPLYFRFIVTNPDQTGMTMKWIRFSNTEPPNFIKASSITDSVYRGRGVDILIQADDQEDRSRDLTVELEYLDPETGTWEDRLLSSGVWDAGHEFHFWTEMTTNIGEYMFRGYITDGMGSRTQIEDLGITIDVLNNLPSTPEVALERGEFFAGDEVVLLPVKNSNDLETQQENITYNITIYSDENLFRQVDGLAGTHFILEEGIIKKLELWNFTIHAWDGVELSLPCSIELTVKNSHPDVTGFPASLETVEDEMIELDLSTWIEEPDMDEYTIEFTPSPYLSVIKNEQGTFLKPMDDWNGITYINFDIFDGELHSNINMTVSVDPDNDPPVFNNISQVTVKEGETIFVDIGAVDPRDNDPISVTNNILEVVPNIQRGSNYVFYPNGSFSFTPTNSMIGEYQLTIGISDGTVEIPLSLTIEIINSNQPPVFPSISIGERRMIYFEDERITLFGEASDPDTIWGDVITYQWSSNIDGNLGEGMGINVSLSKGVHTITLTVVDEGGLTNTSVIEISVKSNSDQGDPTLRTSSYLLIIGAISLVIGSLILLIFIWMRKKKASMEMEETDEMVRGPAEQGRSELDKGKEQEKLEEGKTPMKDLLPPKDITSPEKTAEDPGDAPSIEPDTQPGPEMNDQNQELPKINNGIPENETDPMEMNNMMEPPDVMDEPVPGPIDEEGPVLEGPAPEPTQGGDIDA